MGKIIGSFNFHGGAPSNPAEIRICPAALVTPLRKRPYIVAHAIRKWFGLSFRRRWMIALIIFDETQEGYDIPEPGQERPAGRAALAAEKGRG